MAQPPYQVDGVQIEQTVFLTRDSATGGLKLVDEVLTSGVLLQSLAGLRAVTGVFLVGRGGSGAAYADLQAAVDAVPVTSSLSAPSLILMLPGVYAGNTIIEKDGISIVALGRVVLQAVIDTPTIWIRGGVTVPTSCALDGLIVENAFDAQSCVFAEGGALSLVASAGVVLKGCTLSAPGVGGLPLDCDTVGTVRVSGGAWGGSSSAFARVSQCAAFDLEHLTSQTPIQVAYNSASPAPSVATSYYAVRGSQLGDIVSNLLGVGSLRLSGCRALGDLSLSGDREVLISSCNVGDVTVNAGVAARITASTRGVAVGAGTLDEPLKVGSVSFAGDASKVVVFDVPFSDDTYTVGASHDINAVLTVPTVGQLASGFTLEFPAGVQTGTVRWTVHRTPTL